MDKLDCVILIDDHHPTNVLHKINIEQTKLVKHVKCFNNVKLALNYLQDNKASDYIKPGIIFLDINMPTMDGWEFLNCYNQLSPHLRSNIVLLMLSTSTHPKDLEKAEKEEAVEGYIFKPLKSETIIEWLERIFKLVK